MTSESQNRLGPELPPQGPLKDPQPMPSEKPMLPNENPLPAPEEIPGQIPTPPREPGPTPKTEIL